MPYTTFYQRVTKILEQYESDHAGMNPGNLTPSYKSFKKFFDETPALIVNYPHRQVVAARSVLPLK